VLATFMRYYPVASGQSAMTPATWSTYACSQTAITADAFESCVCPGAAAPSTPPR
jgi:hypothetical protein